MALDILLQETKELPEELLMEIVYFTRFMKSEYAKGNLLKNESNQIKRVPGKRAGQIWMSDDFDEYVFFSDYSWYDGVNYVELGNATNNDNADAEYINTMNDRINKLIRKNDLTLKYDYFKRVNLDETELSE